MTAQKKLPPRTTTWRKKTALERSRMRYTDRENLAQNRVIVSERASKPIQYNFAYILIRYSLYSFSDSLFFCSLSWSLPYWHASAFVLQLDFPMHSYEQTLSCRCCRLRTFVCLFFHRSFSLLQFAFVICTSKHFYAYTQRISNDDHIIRDSTLKRASQHFDTRAIYFNGTIESQHCNVSFTRYAHTHRYSVHV